MTPNLSSTPPSAGIIALVSAVLVLTIALACRPSLAMQEAGSPRSALRAPVESLTARVLDTIPAQVEVALAGTLADSCSRIELIEETARPEEGRIHLALESARPPDAVCAQLLTPYRLTVRLDVSAFSAGDYVVAAEGLEAPFVIEPVGDFPVLSLPIFESDSRIVVPRAGLALVGPGDWERRGLEWTSPPYWSARIGLALRPTKAGELVGHPLPDDAELHESSESRLGWGTGTRYRVSRADRSRWSEHLFVECGPATLCEFWMEAPSEPLLEAAGESFWRMVRFAARLPVS